MASGVGLTRRVAGPAGARGGVGRGWEEGRGLGAWGGAGGKAGGWGRGVGGVGLGRGVGGGAAADFGADPR